MAATRHGGPAPMTNDFIGAEAFRGVKQPRGHSGPCQMSPCLQLKLTQAVPCHIHSRSPRNTFHSCPAPHLYQQYMTECPSNEPHTQNDFVQFTFPSHNCEWVPMFGRYSYQNVDVDRIHSTKIELRL